MAGFHFGGENAPVPQIQTIDTSSGLPSFSEERSTPLVTSSSSQQLSSGSQQRSQRRSSEGEESTLEKPTVKVTVTGSMTMTLESSGMSRAGELQETLSLPEAVEGKMSITSNVAKGKTKGSKAAAVEREQEGDQRREEGEEGRSLRQRFRAAARITPSSNSSTGNVGERAGSSNSSTGRIEEVERATSLPSSSTRNIGEMAGLSSSSTGRSEEAVGTTSLPSSTTRSTGEEVISEIRNPWNAFQHANRGRGWTQEQMLEEYNIQKIKNPWNAFQHRHRGKGWSQTKMLEEYNKEKKRKP